VLQRCDLQGFVWELHEFAKIECFVDKNDLPCFPWRILCYFTGFEAVLKRFQRVSAGGGVPLEKKSRLVGSNRTIVLRQIAPETANA